MSIFQVMKKSAWLLLCVFTLSLLYSCRDDDSVGNRTIFTFSVITPLKNYSNAWVILRDSETGDVLESRMLSATTNPHKFESTRKISNDKMTVTVFWAPNQKAKFAYAQVFSQVDIGSEWTGGDTARTITSIPPEYIDNYALRINNPVRPYSFTLSDKYGSTQLTSFGITGDNKLQTYAGIRGSRRQLISIDPNEGKLKYLFVEPEGNGAENGNYYDVDYNDFKEFDSYINLPITGMSYSDIKVIGYPSTPEYYNSYQLYDNINIPWNMHVSKGENLSIGLLDEFPIYRIDIIYGGIEYHRMGSTPSSLDIKGNFNKYNIADTAMRSFHIDALDHYNFSVSTYRYVDESSFSMQVDYYEPENGPRFDALTDEIASTYILKPGRLKYFRTKIHTGTETYSKMIENTFTDKYDVAEFYENLVLNY